MRWRLALAATSALVASSAWCRAQSPSIPGEVVRPPAWLKAGAPFDLDAFFAMPSASQNAAPLYLDALLEFDGSAAACFPDSPAIRRRKQAADDRQKRYTRLEEALAKNPATVPAVSIDDVVKEYDAGFAKLAAAQKLPRCVFAIGLSLGSPIPHAQAARQVVKVAALRTKRDLARGNIDHALGDLATVLRLCRDLQPRGTLLCQIVSFAMTQVAYKEMIVPILSSKALKADHCRKLIRILVDHDAALIDAYQEALKAEYLMQRFGLRDAAGRPGDADRSAAVKARDSLARAMLTGSLGAGPAEPKPDAVNLVINKLNATPANQWPRQVEVIDGLYRALAELESVPFARRVAEVDARVQQLPKGDMGAAFAANVTQTLQPRWRASLEVFGRNGATLHAAQCLAAIRLWELSKGRKRTDLAEIIAAAKIPSMPIDPFDGQSMKMLADGGSPGVYSVGKDGNDDGGRVDSNFDRTPGDLIYRLP